MANELPFIDPSAGGAARRVPAAPRPASLAGLVVGLLDNTKEQADVILATIGAALCERHGASRVVVRRKAHYSKPAAPALIEGLAGEVHVAVAALGG